MNHIEQPTSILPVVTKGIIGAVAAFGGATVSFLTQLEAWLRIGSLCVGICVGLLTIRSIIKGSNQKSQPPENQ